MATTNPDLALATARSRVNVPPTWPGAVPEPEKGDATLFPEPNALIGDKAFDSDLLRAELNERGVLAVIPPNASRARTIPYDNDMYKRRHPVENFFQKTKEFRRIATRYDKTDTSFRAAIHLVASFLALK